MCISFLLFAGHGQAALEDLILVNEYFEQEIDNMSGKKKIPRYVYMCVYVCIYVSMCIYIYMNIYVYIYMYIYICKYIHIYTYIHR
jgi:uncharacterized membrane protein YbaN (DUF454 family)